MVATTMKYFLLFYISASLFMMVNAFDANLICKLVNDQRAKQGIAPVQLDQRLTNAIKVQVDYCVSTNQLTHDNPAGPLGNRITAAGYAWSTCGENLASGFSTEEAVMNAWMNSAGHRANIMNKSFKHIGVWRSKDTWGQDFGALLNNGPAVPVSGSPTTTPKSTTTSKPTTTRKSTTTSKSTRANTSQLHATTANGKFTTVTVRPTAKHVTKTIKKCTTTKRVIKNKTKTKVRCTTTTYVVHTHRA
ncbi:hypothetical protein Glove_174g42 [Diversispora epigaea]|uniref:SCP domain-containing protein n=1 Tax=Diversispora epigaea TaxID=1348612 RepID=A0A397IRZ6_9GLOM|nr:hypothetical protein Glove_174g42 [Diversispora epigaea]